MPAPLPEKYDDLHHEVFYRLMDAYVGFYSGHYAVGDEILDDARQFLLSNEKYQTSLDLNKFEPRPWLDGSQWRPTDSTPLIGLRRSYLRRHLFGNGMLYFLWSLQKHDLVPPCPPSVLNENTNIRQYECWETLVMNSLHDDTKYWTARFVARPFEHEGKPAGLWPHIAPMAYLGQWDTETPGGPGFPWKIKAGIISKIFFKKIFTPVLEQLELRHCRANSD